MELGVPLPQEEALDHVWRLALCELLGEHAGLDAATTAVPARQAQPKNSLETKLEEEKRCALR